MNLNGLKINLRHPKAADAGSIARYANNKNISEFTFIPFPYAESDAHQFINVIQKDREDMTGLHLGIENKSDDEIIGMVGLNVINHVHRRAEIGYWIGEPFWGKGFAGEAVKLMSEYSFREVGMELLFAYVQPANIGSWKLLESVGYQRDGLLRKFMLKNDQRHDHYFYTLLKSE